MSARVVAIAIGLAVLLVAGCSPEVTVEPTASGPDTVTEPSPVSDGPLSRDEAVAQALGQEALDALGLTPAEVCSTVARWSDQSTNAIVFLQPGATQAEIDVVGEAIAAVDPDATYVSQEDAYLEFTEELFVENESVLDLVTPDILPANYRLSVPADMLDDIAQTFETNPAVREVITERPVFSAAVDAACSGD